MMGANEHCKVLFKDDIKCVSKRAFTANPNTGGRQASNTCELPVGESYNFLRIIS